MFRRSAASNQGLDKKGIEDTRTVKLDKTEDVIHATVWDCKEGL